MPHAPDDPAALPETLKVSEVAALLRLGVSTVYDLARKQLIPHYRVGRSLRFRRADVFSIQAAARAPQPAA